MTALTKDEMVQVFTDAFSAQSLRLGVTMADPQWNDAEVVKQLKLTQKIGAALEDVRDQPAA